MAPQVVPPSANRGGVPFHELFFIIEWPRKLTIGKTELLDRTMDQPVIMCGLGRLGRRVLEYLRAAGMTVVVVDQKCDPADPSLQGLRVVTGDFRQAEVLEAAGLRQARGVLILTSDDLVNISTTLTARHQNPRVRIVVRMFNQNLIPRLGKAVENVFSLSVSGMTALLVALTALTGEALGAFSLEDGIR